jgi:hypothetical protein
MNISGATSQIGSFAPSAVPRQKAESGAVKTDAEGAQGAQNAGISPEDQATLKQLKARDREVRQHEQAHLATAGGLAASGANYSYQRGPDGVNYAVGGEVRIDTSPGRTPEETLRRAEIIVAAALAPADPSGQDIAVAAQARKMALQARQEIARQQAQQAENGTTRPGMAAEDSRRRVAQHYAASSSGPGLSLNTWS